MLSFVCMLWGSFSRATALFPPALLTNRTEQTVRAAYSGPLFSSTYPPFPARTGFRTEPSLLYPFSPLSVASRTAKTGRRGWRTFLASTLFPIWNRFLDKHCAELREQSVGGPPPRMPGPAAGGPYIGHRRFDPTKWPLLEWKAWRGFHESPVTKRESPCLRT